MNEEITALKNIVRVGTVSSVDANERTARVKFSDKNNLVSGPLKVLKNSPLMASEITIDPWLPKVGELVLCVYLPNGESDGFVIGGI